jgi:hypothetical protein
MVNLNDILLGIVIFSNGANPDHNISVSNTKKKPLQLSNGFSYAIVFKLLKVG